MFQSSLEYLKTLKLPEVPSEADISDTDAPESPSMSRSPSVDSISESPATPGRSPSRSLSSMMFNTQNESLQVEFTRLFGHTEGVPLSRNLLHYFPITPRVSM
jgi:hypothetical protein